MKRRTLFSSILYILSLVKGNWFKNSYLTLMPSLYFFQPDTTDAKLMSFILYPLTGQKYLMQNRALFSSFLLTLSLGWSNWCKSNYLALLPLLFYFHPDTTDAKVMKNIQLSLMLQLKHVAWDQIRWMIHFHKRADNNRQTDNYRINRLRNLAKASAA